MKLCHIVAASLNNVIGVKNDLPWHIPEDLKFFKEKTLGKVIIMGRKTFESIQKRPLPKRKNYLVSSSISEYEGFDCFVSIEEAIKAAKNESDMDLSEIFIVGGGEIYKQTLDMVDRIYLTRVNKEIQEGEVFYPSNLEKFKLVSEDKKEGYSFQVYERL